MEVYVDIFCTMVQTSVVTKLCRIEHCSMKFVNCSPHLWYQASKAGIPSPTKTTRGQRGEWDIRKEIVGWVFDSTRLFIDLPVNILDATLLKIKLILRQPSILFKIFEKLVGKLQHIAIVFFYRVWSLCTI